MLRNMLFRAILLSTLVLGMVVSDFSITDHGYEFIYHDLHDLLLVVHDNRCYYASVGNSPDETRFLSTYWQNTQAYVEHLVRVDSHTLQPTSLDIVQQMFGDQLANDRCSGKMVFIINFNVDDICHISVHAAPGCPGHGVGK